ncbi:extracellular solute-binding protein [Nonomuraea jiangxiensis]|uniref:Raffinose/stachyose/melibiose transport system substrate-binding protein n=1 Tax=Nonomuraea jiangxiensis TaxID=633440 RepID=A0A1G9AUU9_9ACTN|nr:extracellular solute-binding protein [Nonomuraea jiangxiensis]SDK31086.1 raffinose/stachyose/melibiose transport system substrate-binding protein [Nonomuraea jiangxiensis]
MTASTRTPYGSRTLTVLAAVALAPVVTLTACAPGSSAPPPAASSAQPSPSSVRTDAAALGNVTLTVWDQEVRGGQAAQMKQLNAAFEAKYPNIKLNRVSRSFDDLNTTLRLALSGNEPPDVVEANNGRSSMGAFVKAGQLRPLDAYAEAYGWKERYPDTVLRYSRYSADGKLFGEGNLYGLPQVGEVVGLYYNAAKLTELGLQPPKTWAEFEAALAKAKAAGQVPLQLGNLDKWPAIHVFGTVQSRDVPAEQIGTLAFGRKGASWNTPENVKAAEHLVGWVDKGYFNKGFNGQGYDAAWQAFGKGEGVFLIAGTWLLADLQQALGEDLGFILPPGATPDAAPVATGGTGLPFAITAKSPNPDAAAAYIDFITSADAMKVLTDTGNLPVADTARQSVPAGPQQDVFTAFGTVTERNGLVPYLDYATPTFADTLGAALQDLMAAKASPQEFLATLEKDYKAFAESNG